MKIIPIIMLFFVSFLIQYILTFMQIKNFNIFYKDLKKDGKVLIGKKKGMFFAGVIVLFSIDDNDLIKKGYKMQGVTVFARFKSFEELNGIYVLDIDENFCKEKSFSHSLKLACLDAVKTFKGYKNEVKLDLN